MLANDACLVLRWLALSGSKKVFCRFSALAKYALRALTGAGLPAPHQYSLLHTDGLELTYCMCIMVQHVCAALHLEI